MRTETEICKEIIGELQAENTELRAELERTYASRDSLKEECLKLHTALLCAEGNNMLREHFQDGEPPVEPPDTKPTWTTAAAVTGLGLAAAGIVGALKVHQETKRKEQEQEAATCSKST